MEMKNKLQFAVAIVTLLLAATLAHADSFSFSFALTPSSSDISGAAGSTIGWGYTITNLDTTNWLAITALNSDLFQNASPNSFLFDFPVLAPGATVSETYAAGLTGLFELTWDSSAPDGFTNAGTFVMSGDFFDADPLSGGNFLQSGADQTAAYSARVASGVKPVPEPNAFLLLIAGCVSVSTWLRRR